MGWNVRFQHSGCDSIKTKTSPGVAAVTERSSRSEAPLENVGIGLEGGITEPSGETGGSGGTERTAPNCLNTEDWEPLILPVCCSSAFGTRRLLFLCYCEWE